MVTQCCAVMVFIVGGVGDEPAGERSQRIQPRLPAH